MLYIEDCGFLDDYCHVGGSVDFTVIALGLMGQAVLPVARTSESSISILDEAMIA